MSLRHFFMSPGVTSRIPKVPVSVPLTQLLVPETNSDGTISVVTKILEFIENPLSVMSFEDFKLENMLKNGVSYKALQISGDYRIGSDADIDAFNDKLASMADKLFVQPSNPE